MSERYQVSPDVGHRCCYEAVVLDEQARWGGENGDKYPTTICECSDVDGANLIAKLLNEYDAAQEAERE